MAPEELDLLVGECAILEDLGGPQLVAAVDVGDGVDDAGEVVAFVHGGVAATDHDDVLAAEEVAIADSAVGDAAASELVLAGGAQLVVGAAGGDDQALGGKGAVVGVHHLDRLIGLFDALDLGVVDFSTEPGGLLLHPHGEFLALDTLGEAGVILDLVGDQKLASGAELLDDEGLEHGTGGIEPGGKPGGPGPENDYIVVCGGCRHLLPFL